MEESGAYRNWFVCVGPFRTRQEARNYAHHKIDRRFTVQSSMSEWMDDYSMGMFDKDKEIGRTLTNEFLKGEEFVLWGVDVSAGPVTDIGPSRKTTMEVQRLANGIVDGDRFTISTLGSAIADKAEQAQNSDFPAVVKWLEVTTKKYDNEATVLQFVREYDAVQTA